MVKKNIPNNQENQHQLSAAQSLRETLPKLSKNQSLVLSQIQKTKEPLSAYQILKQLINTEVSAPQQVYRALDRLMELGYIHRLESINSYILCNQKKPHPTQDSLFAICEKCGHAFEFKAKKALKIIQEKANKKAFHAEQMHIELRGTCGSCLGIIN